MLYLRTARIARGPGDTRSATSLQVLCIFAMALLFRVLSTTAEDYFSPILTQMSKDFYLPPRLAGGECGVATNRCWSSVLLPGRRETSHLPAMLPRRVDTVHHSAPPFAAVTLMAWGNGAPDIFSSMAAVKEGEYALALGGQLGTCGVRVWQYDDKRPA
jgi:Ca2+/Na+ antiporter